MTSVWGELRHFGFSFRVLVTSWVIDVVPRRWTPDSLVAWFNEALDAWSPNAPAGVPGFYHTMDPGFASWHYGFPRGPESGMLWMGSDGSQWVFDQRDAQVGVSRGPSGGGWYGGAVTAKGRPLWELTRYGWSS